MILTCILAFFQSSFWRGFVSPCGGLDWKSPEGGFRPFMNFVALKFWFPLISCVVEFFQLLLAGGFVSRCGLELGFGKDARETPLLHSHSTFDQYLFHHALQTWCTWGLKSGGKEWWASFEGIDWSLLFHTSQWGRWFVSCSNRGEVAQLQSISPASPMAMAFGVVHHAWVPSVPIPPTLRNPKLNPPSPLLSASFSRRARVSILSVCSASYKSDGPSSNPSPMTSVGGSERADHHRAQDVHNSQEVCQFLGLNLIERFLEREILWCQSRNWEVFCRLLWIMLIFLVVILDNCSNSVFTSSQKIEGTIFRVWFETAETLLRSSILELFSYNKHSINSK